VNVSLLEAVSEVAALAGAEALRHFRRRLEVEAKVDGSPVTRADRDAERVVRSWVERHFPDDGILGEEFGESRPGARRRWLVDPVDGTRAFVKGVPLWGTLVAVAEGERVLAGAAEFPALGERLVAARGEGCWWNGACCRVSSVATVDEATVLATDVGFLKSPERGDRWRMLATRAANARTWGDCYGYLLVAIGRAELMADGSVSPWDAAALQVAVEEAGGVFTDWSGRATAFSDGAVATNAALAAELRTALGIPA
jgi:histidinol phosphatase-like enzyme (inositol monophosphatase family)